jgi:L-glutamine-phosphate cytidylyltransferase
MRPIIIGAGRGSRLQHETSELPKTLVEVMGRPMLEWVLEALAAAGFQRKDVVFVCGYAADVIRGRYPEFTYVTNDDWQNNNILASLLYARKYMAQGFVSTYADIVYDGEVVRGLVESPHDFALGCDTAWRRRYVSRSQHPETDAEKLRAEGSRVIEISRHIPSEAAQGEFIGVMKLTAEAASGFCACCTAVRRRTVSRRAFVPEGLPDRSAAANARRRRGHAPRRHTGRLHGNRHAGGPGPSRTLVANTSLSATDERREP